MAPPSRSHETEVTRPRWPHLLTCFDSAVN